jgi:hypothetical protein
MHNIYALHNSRIVENLAIAYASLALGCFGASERRTISARIQVVISPARRPRAEADQTINALRDRTGLATRPLHRTGDVGEARADDLLQHIEIDRLGDQIVRTKLTRLERDVASG